MNTDRRESGVSGKLPYSLKVHVLCVEVHQSCHDRQHQCHLRKLSPVLDCCHLFVRTWTWKTTKLQWTSNSPAPLKPKWCRLSGGTQTSLSISVFPNVLTPSLSAAPSLISAKIITVRWAWIVAAPFKTNQENTVMSNYNRKWQTRSYKTTISSFDSPLYHYI